MKNASYKKLIAGNWKMNGNLAAARALVDGIISGIRADQTLLDSCDFLIAPPFLHIGAVRSVMDEGDSPITLAAQDCSERDNGAFTGDISAGMLADCGVGAVILGHSERRQYHNEDSLLIAAKVAKAHESGLTTIICVGEREEERNAGEHFDVVGRQLTESLPQDMNLENTVIAYEPVWAIGTGKSATPGDIAAMHGFIREKLGNLRILYGGSVKAENAAEVFSTENVDGALIGGASLTPEQYLGIAKAAR